MAQGKSQKDAWAIPMEQPRYIWMSGEMVEWEKATIHASMLGWSAISMVFEGIRGYWNAEHEQLHVFHLDAHLKRLLQSMKLVRMTSPWSHQELVAGLMELLKANEFRGDCYVQPIAYFGDGRPGYLPAVEQPGEIAIFARESSSMLGTDRVVSCGVSSWSRLSDNVMPPRVKAVANYQNSRYVADESSRNGYDMGIVLNQQGKVAEASYACLYIVRDGVAMTPPVTAGILESITREVVKELLERELDVPVVEREVDRTELYVADEVFLCGTGAELPAVGSVDRYQVGEGRAGPIVSRLEQLYHDVVRGRESRHDEWRTPVY